MMLRTLRTFWMRQCVSPWVILHVSPHQSSSQYSVRPFEWDNVPVLELFLMSVLISLQVNIQSDLLNETMCQSLSYSSCQSSSVFKSIFSQTFWMRQCISPLVIPHVSTCQYSSQYSVRPFEWDLKSFLKSVQKWKWSEGHQSKVCGVQSQAQKIEHLVQIWF